MSKTVQFGGVIPSANTLTAMPAVPRPGLQPTFVSAKYTSMVVCNQGAAAVFRIAYSPLGAAVDTTQYFFYDTPLAANASLTIDFGSFGLPVSPTDLFRVRSDTGNVSFNLFGVTD